MVKRRVGVERGLNCWFFVIALACRGRLRGVVMGWHSVLPHMLGVTHSGRLIHFRRTRGRERVCSPWFRGVVEVMPSGYLGEMSVRTTVICF